MFSVPLICSSSGVATVSAMVWGLAPGNCAVTTTEGGTTSGYSEIGSLVMAIRPARKMMTEITPAKIGRSMKNFARFTFDPSRSYDGSAALVGRRRHRLWRNGGAGRQFLQAIQDPPVARFETGQHDPLAIDHRAQGDFTIFRLVAFAHDIDKAFALVVADGGLRHHQAVVHGRTAHLDRDEHARHQRAVFIGKAGAGADGA